MVPRKPILLSPPNFRQEKSTGYPCVKKGAGLSVPPRAPRMGKMPLLTPREVEANLKGLGFSFKNQVGSHRQYEKAATATRKRAVVTVDVGYQQFSKEGMKRMIRQSGYSKEEFCSGVAKDEVPAPPLATPKAANGGKR